MIDAIATGLVIAFGLCMAAISVEILRIDSGLYPPKRCDSRSPLPSAKVVRR